MNEFLLLCLWILMAYPQQVAAACLYGVATVAWLMAAVLGFFIILSSR